MFCNNCGAKLDGQSVCPSCASVNEQIVKKVVPQKPRLVLITKVALLFGLIAFFLPFTTVSCSYGAVTLSGVEMMTTLSLNEDTAEIIDDEEFLPNVFIILSFVLTIVALISAAKTPNMRTCILIGIALVSLILFRATFISYYGLQEDASMLAIEYRWGWIMAMLAYAVSGVCSYLEAKGLTT